MKKKLFLLFALLAFIAAACTRDNLLPRTMEKMRHRKILRNKLKDTKIRTILMFTLEVPITFSAIMDDEQSVKSTLIGTTVSWEPGDAISILWDGGRTVATTASTGATAVFETSVACFGLLCGLSFIGYL